jgi:membrane protein YqaA with SNARE-associated domain
MDILQAALEHGAYLTLAVVSFVSAIFPLVNAELAMVGLVTAMPSPNVLLMVAVATGAQMAGKSLMYWMGRKGGALTTGRYARAMERWSHRFRGSGKGVGALVFVSSASGIPPFYAISTLAGVFRTSFVSFLVVGAAGRFVHFAALGLFPSAIKSIAG